MKTFPFCEDLPQPIRIPRKIGIVATIATFTGSLVSAWHGMYWLCGVLFFAMVVLLLIGNVNHARIRRIEDARWKKAKKED